MGGSMTASPTSGARRAAVERARDGAADGERATDGAADGEWARTRVRTARSTNAGPSAAGRRAERGGANGGGTETTTDCAGRATCAGGASCAGGRPLRPDQSWRMRQTRDELPELQRREPVTSRHVTNQRFPPPRRPPRIWPRMSPPAPPAPEDDELPPAPPSTPPRIWPRMSPPPPRPWSEAPASL